ncbi:tetratricopeptide repeat protein [Candidatus Jidaibacter acanthamoebae]|nr:tetratricopeptide repeat protein [Candidatus Jidaibacter acanthamoeba]
MNGKDYSSRAERELEDIEKQIEEITKASLKGKDKLNSESMVGEDELSQAIDLSTMIFSKKEGDKENLTSSTTEFKLSRLQNQINTECAAVLSSILPRIHIRSKVYTESILQVPQEATLRIIRYLSAQDLIQLSQVSKEFSKAGKLNKYLIIEQRYAAELRKLVYDYTLTPCFEIGTNLIKTYKELGDLYIDIGRVSNKAEDYTDAAVFYQYVLSMVERVREEQKDTTNQKLDNYEIQAFEQLEVIWRELSGLVCISINGATKLVEQESKDNRTFLKRLREKAEQKVKEIDEVSLKKEEAESAYELEEYFINETRGLFEHIAEQVKGFIARIFKECEEVIGKPPCKYSVIGLGSLALNQFTPYSDLEFAILTGNEEYKHNSDPKVQNYFKNLSHLVHFKVICLGETIIPTSKYSINLESFVCRGFNFDLGGKTPLGRIEKDKDYELIQTPEKMARYLDEKYSHIDKNLPYILEASCFIYKEKSLFIDYKRRVTEFLNKLVNGLPNREQRTVKRLKEGVKEFNHLDPSKPPILVKGDLDVFQPRLFGQEIEGKLVDVKQEIYRLPDRYIYSIAVYYGLEFESLWEAIEKMKNEEIIVSVQEEVQNPKHNLQYIVSFASMLRLRTYINNKGQFERISILYSEDSEKEVQNGIKKTFYLSEYNISEHGGLLKYYYISEPLHRSLADFCMNQKSFTSSTKKFFFNKRCFYNDSPKVKGSVYLRLLQYKKAFIALKEGMNEQPTDARLFDMLGHTSYRLGMYDEAYEFYSTILHLKENMYGKEHMEYVLSLNNIALILYEKGKYSEALKYLKQGFSIVKKLIQKEHIFYAAFLNNIAEVLKTQGQYTEALGYLKQALSIREKTNGKEHPNYIISLRSFALMLKKHGKYSEALKYLKQGLFSIEKVYGKIHPKYAAFLSNIALTVHEQGQYTEALEYLKQALVIREKVYGKEHPEYANSFNDIGTVLFAQGHYLGALENYKQALFITEKARGKQHHNYAISLSNIAKVMLVQGKYLDALNELTQALNILEMAYNKDHAEYATVLSGIASIMFAQGRYVESFKKYKQALGIREKIYGKDHPDYAGSLNNVALVLLSQGKYTQALAHERQALGIKEKVYGKEHPEYANSLYSIGTILFAQGQYIEALEYFKQALGIREKIYGRDHPDYAISLGSIATMLHTQGYYAETLEYYNKALVIIEKVYGKDHPEYATFLSGIAFVLYDQGLYPESLKYHNQALGIREKVYGKEHPEYATSLSGIALVLYDQALYLESSEYHEQVLNIREKVYGKEHPEYATSLSSIASIFTKQGKYQEALEYHNQALIIREKVYGKDHPDYSNSLYNVGNVLEVQGKHKQALEYHKQALNIREKAYGKDHPDYSNSLYNIGKILGVQGKYEEALEYHKQALIIREKVYGKDHPDYASSLSEIASVLNDQGHYMSALKYHKQALAIREKIYGKEHPSYAFALNMIAFTLKNLGQYTKSLENYNQALAIIEKVHGREHPEYASSLSGIALILYDQGYYKESLNSYDQALAIIKKTWGMNSSYHVSCLNGIAAILNVQGLYRKSLKHYNQSLAIIDEVHGKEHPYYASCLSGIASIFNAQGLYIKALEYYKEVLSIREKVYGKEHPYYASCLSNIASIFNAQGLYAKALEYYNKALVKIEKVHGKEHLDYVNSLSEKAKVLGTLGNYNEALEGYKQASTIVEKVCGKNYPYYANLLNGIASVLYNQGHYKKALKKHNQSLAIIEKVHSKEHPYYAICLNNLALTLKAGGHYNEALEKYKQALNILKEVYGKEHSDYANSLSGIASILTARKQYIYALLYYKQVLTIREKIYGKEHSDYANGLNNIAEILYYQGKYSDALLYDKLALTIIRRVYGTNHPDSANLLNNTATVLYALKEYKEAFDYYNQASIVIKQIYGEEHPYYANSLSGMALVFKVINEYEKSLSYHKQALAIRERVYGKEHPYYASSLSYIASLLSSQKQYEEALEYFQQVLVIREKTIGKEDYDYINSLNSFATILFYQGKFNEALSNYKQVLNITERVYGKEHALYSTCFNNILDVLEAQKKQNDKMILEDVKEDTLVRDSSFAIQDMSKEENIYLQIHEIVKSFIIGEHCKELKEYILSVDIGEALDKKWDGILFNNIKRAVEEYNKKGGILSRYEGEELVEAVYDFIKRRLKQERFEVTERAKKLCEDILEWEAQFKTMKEGAVESLGSASKEDEEYSKNTGKKLRDLSAAGDDRNLISNGEDRKYWYSVTDGFRLLVVIRKSMLCPIDTVGKEEERYVTHRENEEGIFIADPYHSDNFREYLRDDIARITGNHEIEEYNNDRWQSMPRVIVLPILYGLHWRSVRIEIDYESRGSSILYDDPYGVGHFPKQEMKRLLQVIKEQIGFLIRTELRNKRVEVGAEEIEVKEYEKKIDQQGSYENSYDCGVIIFSNIRGYSRREIRNEVYAEASGEEENKYSLSPITANKHEEEVVRIRARHIRECGEIAGLEINTDRSEEIEERIKQSSKNRVDRLAGNELSIGKKISELPSEYIEMIFSILEQKRALGKGERGEYTEEELEGCYKLLFKETEDVISLDCIENYIGRGVGKEDEEELDNIVLLNAEKTLKKIEGIREEVDSLYATVDIEECLHKIKEGLKLCNNGINIGKYYEQEYKLFLKLGDIYSRGEDRLDYPKAVGIYQYVLNIIDRLPDKIKKEERRKAVENKIESVEEKFIKQFNNSRQLPEGYSSKTSLEEIKKYKENLITFRALIKDKLTQIEDMGIKEGEEEIEEEGLEKRAKEVEKIYGEIREYFIGENGLIKRLLNDCIKELGGLPKVIDKKTGDGREVEYVVFGIGSMALGTMTPWSDMEWGVLIEEGLEREEERVKEYFRNLTVLMYIKVTNFGESLLTVFGIKELNNFKQSDGSDKEHNWFYDSISRRGFSFDGSQWHACKSPLGRKGYRGHNDFELIGTSQEIANFQNEEVFKLDAELSQALGYLTLISGDERLMSNYFEKVRKYQSTIQHKAFEIIKSDEEKYNPSLLFEAVSDGKILDIKKDVYRFPDRILAGLGNCILGIYPYQNSWDLLQVFKNERIISKEAYLNLSIMLDIAVELRLRNYIDNESQEGRLFLKQSPNFIFEKYNLLLNAFFFRSFSLHQSLTDITSYKAVKFVMSHYSFGLDRLNLLHIKGLINQKFLRYTEAEIQYNQLMTFYKRDKLRIDLTPDLKIIVIQTLFSLGHIYYRRDKINKAIESYVQAKELIGENKPYLELVYHICMGNIHFKREEYDDALLDYEVALKNTLDLFGEKSIEYGIILCNVANIFFRKNLLKKAEKIYLKSLEVFKGNETYSVSCLVNLGNIYYRQNNFPAALSRYKESLVIKEKSLYSKHYSIAGVLVNIGNCCRYMEDSQDAINFYNKAIWIYENGFVDDQLHYAAVLNNIACTYRDINRYDMAIKHCLKALRIKEEVLGKDSLDYAISLNLLGDLYISTEEHDKAEVCLLKSLNTKINKKDTLEIAHTKKSLAIFYFKLSQLEKVLSYAVECYFLYLSCLDDTHSLVQNTRMLILCVVSKILISQNNQSNPIKAQKYLKLLIEMKPTEQELQSIGLDEQLIVSNLQFSSDILNNGNYTPGKLIENHQVTKMLTILTGKHFKAFLRNDKSCIVDAVFKVDKKEDLEKYTQYLSERYNLPFMLERSPSGDYFIVLKEVNITEQAHLITEKFKRETIK